MTQPLEQYHYLINTRSFTDFMYVMEDIIKLQYSRLVNCRHMAVKHITISDTLAHIKLLLDANNHISVTMHYEIDLVSNDVYVSFCVNNLSGITEKPHYEKYDYR